MNKEITPDLALQKVVERKEPQRSENVLLCAKAMMEDIHHGKSWPTEELATLLNRRADSAQFGYDLSEVNRMLELRGYHLTSRGKNGREYFVDRLDRTASIAKSMNADALRMMRRAALFLHGTLQNHSDKMSEADQLKLKKCAEITALRYVLCHRVR